MFEALPWRAMGVQGRAPRADRGPVLAKVDSSSCGPDAISSSTCNPACWCALHLFSKGITYVLKPYLSILLYVADFLHLDVALVNISHMYAWTMVIGDEAGHLCIAFVIQGQTS